LNWQSKVVEAPRTEFQDEVDCVSVLPIDPHCPETRDASCEDVDTSISAHAVFTSSDHSPQSDAQDSCSDERIYHRSGSRSPSILSVPSMLSVGSGRVAHAISLPGMIDGLDEVVSKINARHAASELQAPLSSFIPAAPSQLDRGNGLSGMMNEIDTCAEDVDEDFQCKQPSSDKTSMCPLLTAATFRCDVNQEDGRCNTSACSCYFF